VDVLALRSVVRDANFAAHGVAATVTRPWPDDTPITTTGIWCTPGLSRPFIEAVPGDFDLQRRDRHRVMALMVKDVATLPKRTRIDAPEVDGGPVLAWRVDSTEYADALHRRVIVVPETEI
jgi:hypothetical protein